MITIDVTNEYEHQSEKPVLSDQPARPAAGSAFDFAFMLAQSHHDQLMQAAHTARLLKTEDGPAIDVQRWFSNVKSEFLTLAERYARRGK